MWTLPPRPMSKSQGYFYSHSLSTTLNTNGTLTICKLSNACLHAWFVLQVSLQNNKDYTNSFLVIHYISSLMVKLPQPFAVLQQQRSYCKQQKQRGVFHSGIIATVIEQQNMYFISFFTGWREAPHLCVVNKTIPMTVGQTVALFPLLPILHTVALCDCYTMEFYCFI